MGCFKVSSDGELTEKEEENKTSSKNPIPMTSVMNALSSVEGWFNKKFGWFFTNGSKHMEEY